MLEELNFSVSNKVVLELFIMLQLHVVDLSLQPNFTRTKSFLERIYAIAQLLPCAHNGTLFFVQLLHEEIALPRRGFLRVALEAEVALLELVLF